VLVAAGFTGTTTLGSAELYTPDRIFAGNFDGTQTSYP
jgi:hypothetical protein